MRKDVFPASSGWAALSPAAIHCLFALLLLVCGWPSAVRAQSDSARHPVSQQTGVLELPDVLATIDDERITLADLRATAGPRFERMEIEYLRGRSQGLEDALEELIRDRLLEAAARRQGKTVEELIEIEIGAERLTPSESEVAAWYESNPGRTRGRTLDDLRVQVSQLLRQQRRDEAGERLVRQLTSERRVVVHLQPVRHTFDNSGSPALGSQDAPVTIVEFADFQCPFCRDLAPALKRAVTEFGDKVRLVYRQFPLVDIHPEAFHAAEASLCAHEQEKFWAMHDLMFEEQDRLTIADLKAKARRLELDRTRFGECIDGGRFSQRVHSDIAEGEQAGVDATPAVFVNGVPLPGGAVPYNMLAAAVQRELARLER